MKITIENYEAYALDYLEGSLEPREEQEFQNFLEEHPEIMEELAGLDQVVLIPDKDLYYPHKKSLYQEQKGGIIPLWRSSWMIAASVAIFLAVGTFLFLRNSTGPEPYLSDYHKEKLPAIEAMPEDLPETNVMAQKGNVPVQVDDTEDGSPALTFEPSSPKEMVHQPLRQAPIAVNTPDKSDHTPISTSLPDPLDNTDAAADEGAGIQKIPAARAETGEALALLPVMINTIQTPASSLNLPTIQKKSREESAQFEIRIPGNFLSETWTDVSFTSIKSKLLPEFLSTRNNN